MLFAKSNNHYIMINFTNLKFAHVIVNFTILLLTFTFNFTILLLYDKFGIFTNILWEILLLWWFNQLFESKKFVSYFMDILHSSTGSTCQLVLFDVQTYRLFWDNNFGLWQTIWTYHTVSHHTSLFDAKVSSNLLKCVNF